VRNTDFIWNVYVRDGMGQHFWSPARPEVTRNRSARPVYAKPQIIFWPGAARGP